LGILFQYIPYSYFVKHAFGVEELWLARKAMYVEDERGECRLSAEGALKKRTMKVSPDTDWMFDAQALAGADKPRT